MDGHRPNVLTVLVHIGEVETLGQHHQVHLDRGGLPLAPQGVLHLDVDLGRVEGSVAFFRAVAHARALQRLAHELLGAVPQRGVTQCLLGARAEREVRLQPEP